MSDRDTGGQDTGDAIEVDIRAAQDAGDDEEAARLYRVQQGVADEGQLHTGDFSFGALTVSTSADGETATPATVEDFADNPDDVAVAVEQMRASWGDEADVLVAKWGSNIGTELSYFSAFALAVPEVYALLKDHDLGDHRAIVEAGAMLGRRYVKHG